MLQTEHVTVPPLVPPQNGGMGLAIIDAEHSTTSTVDPSSAPLTHDKKTGRNIVAIFRNQHSTYSNDYYNYNYYEDEQFNSTLEMSINLLDNCSTDTGQWTRRMGTMRCALAEGNGGWRQVSQRVDGCLQFVALAD